jgi:hypothetical protein
VSPRAAAMHKQLPVPLSKSASYSTFTDEGLEGWCKGQSNGTNHTRSDVWAPDATEALSKAQAHIAALQIQVWSPSSPSIHVTVRLVGMLAFYVIGAKEKHFSSRKTWH